MNLKYFVTTTYNASSTKKETYFGGSAEYVHYAFQVGSVWTKNTTLINLETDKPVFIDSTNLPSRGLPSNHPAWTELESMLLEIDQIPNYADDLDDNWLDNLRSGWSNRSSDFYDFTDWD